MISTTRVPSDRTAPISVSIAVVADGSRLEVGSSRIRISGPVAERAGDRQQLLLAARQDASRRMHQMREPGALQCGLRAPGAIGARHAGDRQSVLDVGQRRAAQQHRPLEHEADLGRAAPVGQCSRPRSPGPPWAATRPARTRTSRLLPAPFGPISTSVPVPSISMSMPSRMRRPPRSKASPRRGSAGPRRRVDRACRCRADGRPQA